MRDHEVQAQIPHLRRYALSLIGDPIAADDLVQDCLERALSRWNLFRRGTNLRGWLFTIMHNLFVNHVARQQRIPQLAVLEDSAVSSAAANQEHRVQVGDMARALDSLPPEQREILLLIGMEGVSYEEAAAITGVPVGTVMSRLHRGRERLRRLMNGNGEPNLRRVK